MLNFLDNAVVALTSEGAAGAAASFDLEGILSNAVATVQTNMYNTLGIVVPAIVGISAVVICVKFGLRWIRKMANG